VFSQFLQDALDSNVNPIAFSSAAHYRRISSFRSSTCFLVASSLWPQTRRRKSTTGRSTRKRAYPTCRSASPIRRLLFAAMDPAHAGPSYTAASALLPLTVANQWKPTVLFCGGSNVDDTIPPDRQSSQQATSDKVRGNATASRS
jgi:hypothetical protein